ncbi:PilZ domain-containing protein [Sphingopyxis sp. MWB1]|uniref:PilZ domain-containing protein n=1 Tax=Sphingopyxis sp. MWB1 TaxID=1537715 RepID=UPI00051A25A3|nr:PilZ domain-containing protein [Sphingopyxis sp. MWB1]
MSTSKVETDANAASEKRQPRQSRLVKASLACERLGQFDVTIRNISQTGVGGRGPHALHIGERVTLLMPGHEPMAATVRWVRDKQFGLETDKSIEAGRLRSADGEAIIPADGKGEFQIMRPPATSAWRPGLSGTAPRPGHYGSKS